jgi:glycosyltransferase involved in cell wall biosynthesis
MPSYNQGRFIRQAIDSVLGQEYPPKQLIVMDGGSSDETVSILRGYGDRLTFVSQRDGGQSDALNQGFARAQGELLGWLNSDDVYMPGAFEAAAQAFQQRPDVGFVYGRGWDIDELGRVIGDSGAQPFNLWKLLHHRNFLHQPSCFFRRSLLEAVGPVRTDLHYAMDYELWMRFGAHKGLFLDKPLSCNRVYASNKTQSGALRRWREVRDLVRASSNRRYPPALWAYLLEAVLQLLHGRRGLGCLRYPLRRLLGKLMRAELSGHYADGGLAPAFAFSVPNAPGSTAARLLLSPLSRYAPARLGKAPLEISWKSSASERGTFRLLENGCQQEVELPLGSPAAAPFTHFRCRASGRGVRLSATPRLPNRRVVAFLDSVEPVEALAVGATLQSTLLSGRRLGQGVGV